MKELLEKISEYEFILRKEKVNGMKVNAKLFISEELLKSLEDEAIKQLSDVTKMNGITEPAIAMPDAHVGYGFPVGAIAAFDTENGIISAGMVGFDINCGINLLKVDMNKEEIMPKIKELTKNIFRFVPAGVGSQGRLRLTKQELDEVLSMGGKWALENSYATEEDLKNCEENGFMNDANPEKVSEIAKQRGLKQLGTLGAGNHFLEIQYVDKIYDEELARKYKIEENQITVMIHTGSRGLGHQIASDYLKIHEKAVKKYNLSLPNKQLVSAPINSKEGQDYFSAMKCAVNFAFVNRFIITSLVRKAFEKTYNLDFETLGIKTIYGIAHNICKREIHKVNNKKVELYVHRKGATRAFPDTPVIIAGSMGTSSYLLEGTELAMEKSFGSTCHGAGRLLSRTKAIKNFNPFKIKEQLNKEGKILMATTNKIIAEEAPKAYKDVDLVVNVVDNVGISKKVARMIPISIIKG